MASKRLADILQSDVRRACVAGDEAMLLSSVGELLAGLPHRHRLVLLTTPCTFLKYEAPHESATATLMATVLYHMWEEAARWLLGQGVTNGPLMVAKLSPGQHIHDVSCCLPALLASPRFDTENPKCMRCLRLLLQNTPEVYDVHCLLGYHAWAGRVATHLQHPAVRALYYAWLRKWKRWLDRGARKLWLSGAVSPMPAPTHVFPVVCA
jgi:hypothetical protein